MPRLRFITIQGTPFEAGLQLGRFGAEAMQAYRQTSPAWASIMLHRNSPAVAQMADRVRTTFPRIWEELRGLATGLELPFDEVFMWNCRGDLWSMAPDGCTTVLQAGPPARITHNEDGDPLFAGHCAVASFAIEGGASFASFVYPGSIPGHTFAVTDSGLAMTVNNLRCREIGEGTPRMVLTRALLDTASLDDAIDLLRHTPRSGGFHLTLAHRSAPRLLSVEFSARACSVIEVTQPSLHANHAVHTALREFPQLITLSSLHRQKRGDDLLCEAAGQSVDPLRILADDADAALPIYRTAPDDSDDENTMATADIVVDASAIRWQVYEDPRQPPRFHMIDGHVTQENVSPLAT